MALELVYGADFLHFFLYIFKVPSRPYGHQHMVRSHFGSSRFFGLQHPEGVRLAPCFSMDSMAPQDTDGTVKRTYSEMVHYRA